MRAHIALLLLLGVTSAASAQRSAQDVTPIRFARGASSAAVAGSVIRGERALYSLDARAGQTLTARISAAETNAVFQLYAPGARAALRDGMLDVTGHALPGAGDGADARAWEGRLPADGAYLFIIGGTRGNAQYSLSVTVR